jgi:hypothetical protein
MISSISVDWPFTESNPARYTDTMTIEATKPRTTPSRGRLMTTLFAAQVCGSTGHSIGMAIGGITAAAITGTNTWSGIPIAVGALGTALASWPLSRLMERSGRRPGLALGYGLAVLGALIAMAAVTTRSFPLLLAGMALFGISQTSNLLSRYAAADVSPSAQRGRAMGLIVWGSSAGSILGPNLMEPALRLGRSFGLEPTASTSTKAPTPIIMSRPKRSLSQPDSGEATYMPPRCMATARPMVPTECPWSCR